MDGGTDEEWRTTESPCITHFLRPHREPIILANGSGKVVREGGGRI